MTLRKSLRLIILFSKIRRPEYWEGKIEMAEKRSPLPSLVAEMKGKEASFILEDARGWEYDMPGNIGWSDTIGVDPSCRKRGVARLLLHEMFNYLKKAGVDTVCTLVNRSARGLLQFFDATGLKRGGMIKPELKIGA